MSRWVAGVPPGDVRRGRGRPRGERPGLPGGVLPGRPEAATGGAEGLRRADDRRKVPLLQERHQRLRPPGRGALVSCSSC